MTREQAFLWVAEAVMLFALGCFLRAFWLRRRDLRRHMAWGRAGAWSVLLALALLEVVKRVLGWEFPVRSRAALEAHVAVAVAAFLLLLALWYTGSRRLRPVHVRLYWFFLPLFSAAVVLSFFAFDLW